LKCARTPAGAPSPCHCVILRGRGQSWRARGSLKRHFAPVLLCPAVGPFLFSLTRAGVSAKTQQRVVCESVSAREHDSCSDQKIIFNLAYVYVVPVGGGWLRSCCCFVCLVTISPSPDACAQTSFSSSTPAAHHTYACRDKAALLEKAARKAAERAAAAEAGGTAGGNAKGGNAKK
jgi:hypothetical protein